MKKIIYILFAIILLYSCSTTHMAYNQDLSFMYRRDVSVLHPHFQIYHTSDQLTDIYFSINSSELLYSRQPNETDYTSRIVIKYSLVPSYESKLVVDSGAIKMTDVNNESVNKLISGKLTVKANAPNSYLLKINVFDLNRNMGLDIYLDLYKTSPLSLQNFFVSSKKTGAPLFRDYVLPGETVLISYKRSAQKRLVGRFYKHDFPIAAPPFSLSETKSLVYKPDSSFVVELNDSGSVEVNLKREGMYSFVTDTTQREGLTLFRYYDGFPSVIKAEQLIYPLRYITSKEEYDDMITAKNKKLAIDNFWFNCSGSIDKSKEAIRKFYNRVNDANIYFSSYLEGWKTDRGMIYLILGPPNLVYRNSDGETWVYGENNNSNSLNFTFSKVSNPFTDKDYYLQRSAIYKSNWFRGVDIWREGRIYLQN